ncbi:GAF domain-containing sensor histidine kinase [Actinoplanes sp. NPDC049118]|uniref:sensor histidine kinase n=1 Tax=Actinoplanes sp. NPDC049118 TaxID=3155769 RepID=UPI0033FE5C74
METGDQGVVQLSAQEQEVLAQLESYDALNGERIPDLDVITALAANLCEVPTAVINVLTADQQIQIAAVGFEESVCRREDAMCAVTVVSPEPVIVADASSDPRFANNPFVTGVIDSIRFYAATQLRGPAGHVLGTLCVFDRQPRTLNAVQRVRLNELAMLVVDVLELRRRTHQLQTILADRDQVIGELGQLRTELERSNEALLRFAGTVAHDLRGPLTCITGTAGLLAEEVRDGDPSAVTAEVNTISRAAQRMGTVIDDLLTYAGVGGRPKQSWVDLNDLVSDVIEDVSAAIDHEHAIVHVGALPTVESDPTHLRLLLQNLLGNALKFRRPDRPCVINIEAIARPYHWVLRVADNGIGIPADKREAVLQPFVRLAQEIPGHGIGLATCTEILRTHHGRFEIGDTPGGGTTFTATFLNPRQDPPGDTEAETPRAGPS